MIPESYASIGGIPLWNSTQLAAYVANTGASNLDFLADCGCDALTAEVLGDAPYTVPSDPAGPTGGGAIWYDPDVPDSGAFLGALILTVEGMDDYPVTRSVTTAVTGGGALGPARVLPRTITVTGILVGTSCCGVSYGLKWLQSAMQGCTGSACGGDCAVFYDCCSKETPPLTAAQYNARYRRTFRRTALISGPTVTGKVGGGDCSRCSGADVIQFEAVFSAATPWPYTDPVEVLDVSLPEVDDSCVEWCTFEAPGPIGEEQPGVCAQGSCHLKACVSAGNGCGDPNCAVATPPSPTAGTSCFCTALAFECDCYMIDLSTRPNWGTDVPTFELSSGAAPLRNVQIALYETTAADDGLTCEQIVAKRRCEPLAVWNVSYLPADAVLTLDGEVGRATVTCQGVCSSATNVWGRDGGAPVWPVLECSSYVLSLCVDALADPPAANAGLTMSVSGRGL